MVKRIIFYFIVLVIAILAGLMLQSTSGYVLFAYNHWTVEMPLWFFVVTFIALFFMLHYGLRGLLALCHLSDIVQAWRDRRNFRKAHTLTGQGLLALIEAHWHEAEKHLLRGVKSSRLPAINYLGAAVAAQEQQALNRRDDYLAQAHRRVPAEEIAISLVQTQLQLNQQQFELARASLQRLQNIAPKHAQVLKLLKTLYLQTEGWQELLHLLPKLQKILTEKAFEQLAIITYKNLLDKQKSLEGLQAIWSDIPRKMRGQPDILMAYCREALQFKQDAIVLQLITNFLNKDWHEGLVNLYGLAKSDRPEKQLATAESWMKRQKNNATLYLTLGRIATRFKHWAKAEEYLMSSLRLKPNPQTYAILAYVYQQTDQLQKALDIYQKECVIL